MITRTRRTSTAEKGKGNPANVKISNGRGVCDDQDITEYGLLQKVNHLEGTLTKFRSEVDTKMKIMQKVLSERNDLLLLQKKLLVSLSSGIDREQSLHQFALSHWSDISAGFIDNNSSVPSHTLLENETSTDTDDTGDNSRNIHQNGLKRKSTSMARRQRKKKQGNTAFKAAESEHDIKVPCSPIPIPSTDSGRQEDDETDMYGSDFERQVYVEYYSETPVKPGDHLSNAQIWKYFLREEGGESGLCKLCDENAFQCIIKVSKGPGTRSLVKHLKTNHGLSITQEDSRMDREIENARSCSGSDSDSENDGGDEQSTRKGKRGFKYTRFQNFATKEECDTFVKNAKEWTQRFTQSTSDDTRTYYNCKWSRNCPVRMYLTYSKRLGTVVMHRTSGVHNHPQKIVGLPELTKNEVRRLYDSGVTKPNPILEALDQANFMKPTKTQLNNFLTYLRMSRAKKTEAQDEIKADVND